MEIGNPLTRCAITQKRFFGLLEALSLCWCGRSAPRSLIRPIGSARLITTFIFGWVESADMTSGVTPARRGVILRQSFQLLPLSRKAVRGSSATPPFCGRGAFLSTPSQPLSPFQRKNTNAASTFFDRFACGVLNPRLNDITSIGKKRKRFQDTKAGRIKKKRKNNEKRMN